MWFAQDLGWSSNSLSLCPLSESEYNLILRCLKLKCSSSFLFYESEVYFALGVLFIFTALAMAKATSILSSLSLNERLFATTNVMWYPTLLGEYHPPFMDLEWSWMNFHGLKLCLGPCRGKVGLLFLFLDCFSSSSEGFVAWFGPVVFSLAFFCLTPEWFFFVCVL